MIINNMFLPTPAFFLSSEFRVLTFVVSSTLVQPPFSSVRTQEHSNRILPRHGPPLHIAPSFSTSPHRCEVRLGGLLTTSLQNAEDRAVTRPQPGPWLQQEKILAPRRGVWFSGYHTVLYKYYVFFSLFLEEKANVLLELWMSNPDGPQELHIFSSRSSSTPFRPKSIQIGLQLQWPIDVGVDRNVHGNLLSTLLRIRLEAPFERQVRVHTHEMAWGFQPAKHCKRFFQ